MEMLSIARALWRKPTGALLVGLQIAISLAVIINAALFVHSRIEKVQKDNGMDTNNIIAVITIGTDKTYPEPNIVAVDIEKIQQVPGVKRAAFIHSVPESGGGSATRIKNGTEDNAKSIVLNYYLVSNGIIDTLGLKLIEGRSFAAQDVEHEAPNKRVAIAKTAVITRSVAEALFPGESAIGKLVYNKLNMAAEVIGVVEHMHGAWPEWEGFNNVALFPIISSLDGGDLLTRVEPGMRNTLQSELETMLSEDQSRRLISKVTSMQAIREETYNNDTALAKLLLVVIALLTAISTLGVVALAAFTVKQRTRQIGTRRAIGARKSDILLYFFKENSLVCITALVLGSLLGIALNMLLVKYFAMPKLAPSYIIAGCLLLWLASALAVYRPAKAASSISPVVATRNV